MHTVLSRLNVVFAYCLSVLAAVTFACFLTTYTILPSNNPEIEYDVSRQIVKHVRDFTAARAKNDLGFLKFDIKAEYKTEDNELNQVVLWDKIIKRGENANLDLREMNSKYYFFDDGSGLRGHDNITLTFSWNTIPNAGIIHRIKSPFTYQFTFPAEYTKTR